MIPVQFEYARPNSIESALELLSGENTVLLAGGHTLMTALKHRRIAPQRVVDIAALDLDEIDQTDSQVKIGANVRQGRLMQALRGRRFDLVAMAGDAAGDPSIRARGTFVGALCALEPFGDWVSAALALDATVDLVSTSGRRTISMEALANGSEQISPQEIAVSATLIAPPESSTCSYQKVKHAAIGWGVASAAIVRSDRHARVAVSGLCEVPARLERTEAALIDGAADVADAIMADIASLPCIGDSYASAEYRRHRLSVLLKRMVHTT